MHFGQYKKPILNGEQIEGTSEVSNWMVQPVAVRSSIDVFGQNKRLVMDIETEEFGSVVYVIIAAVQVGSIVMSVKEGQRVSKVRCRLPTIDLQSCEVPAAFEPGEH